MVGGSFKNIIDSHFHTESMLERGMDIFSVYDRLFSEGFLGGIDIGCTHDDLPRRAELLSPYPKILLAGAMGPWEAGRNEKNPPDPDFRYAEIKSFEKIGAELECLRENLKKYKASFIGEIGLDYYWSYGTPEKQRFIFESQMKTANETGKAVLIHNREADEDTAEIIKRCGPEKGGVIHCFNGSETLMNNALECGYYISFAGNLTFKSNQNLRTMLKRIPLDRLLLETDSPYLAPVPERGKPNCPEYVKYTYECAALTLGLSLEKLTERVAENFKELCGR